MNMNIGMFLWMWILTAAIAFMALSSLGGSRSGRRLDPTEPRRPLVEPTLIEGRRLPVPLGPLLASG